MSLNVSSYSPNFRATATQQQKPVTAPKTNVVVNDKPQKQKKGSLGKTLLTITTAGALLFGAHKSVKLREQKAINEVLSDLLTETQAKLSKYENKWFRKAGRAVGNFFKKCNPFKKKTP